MEKIYFKDLIKADIDRYKVDCKINCPILLFFFVDFYPVFLLRIEEYAGLSSGFIKFILNIFAIIMRPFVQGFSSTRIYRGVTVGRGILLHACVGTAITPKAVIGANCTIFSCVTIAHRADGKGSGAPVIGDNVKIMSGAKIIGPVSIGDNCIIGANSVVSKNMPDNCIATGNPAIVREIK
jgi:serine O-acetyltransferase